MITNIKDNLIYKKKKNILKMITLLKDTIIKKIIKNKIII